MEIPSLKERVLRLTKAERSFYQQKAKCTFLAQSDKSTKYFHNLVKRNGKKNSIASVSKLDESSTKSMEEVANCFVEYFRGLFGTSKTSETLDPSVLAIGRKLDSEAKSSLSAEITNDEIKLAMFSIGDDKAPGPDGFTSKFFKKAWPVVGNGVCEATKEFFRNANLLKQVNHTSISLIPKTSNAQKVSDYRPIACCNVTYKVITKILAARIAPFLEDLIDDAQGAFVPNRLMTENVHLMQELLRKYNRKRESPRCTIKIDLCKAYDTVSWTFLREVLIGLDFPTVFVDWVMACVTTPSFSVTVNGGMHGHFKGERGLRQGDPMSPMLFILCLEYLSRLIKSKTDGTDFNYHPLCQKLKITHLAFADDLMLMSRGDPISIGILLGCLKDFEVKSGLEMNVAKSCVYTAGIQEETLRSIQESSLLLRGVMPFRYLGIPLASVKLTVAEYSPLTDKISSLITGWKGETLTYAGRAELISTVIQGIVAFWFGVFLVPPTVQHRVTCLCRDFFWGKKSALVKWDSICQPKGEGGLGFRDLKAWNQALLAKNIWNVCAKKDSLWIKWVSHIYLKDVDIWDWQIRKSDSPLMKAFHQIKSTIREGTSSKEEAVSLMKSWYGIGGKPKLAYDFFRQVGTPKPWASVVWCPQNTPKHSYILWLATLKRIKTRDRITWGEVDPLCPLCGEHNESRDHLFFDCRLSRYIWGKIKDAVGLRRQASTLASALKWTKKEGRGTSWMAKGKKIALSTTVYHIWYARNRKAFEGETPNVDQIVGKILTHIYRTLYSLYPRLLPQLEDHTLTT